MTYDNETNILLAEFDLRASLVPTLEEKIEELNKPLTRKKDLAGGFSLEIGPIFTKIVSMTLEQGVKSGGRIIEDVVDGRVPVELPYQAIRLYGQKPFRGSWRFAARIEHGESGDDDQGRNMVITAPDWDIELPKEFRSSRNYCDECGTSRHRIETFVVYNTESDEFRQLGRNCLTEYIFTRSADSVARWIKQLEAVGDLIRSITAGGDDDYGFGGSRVPEYVDLGLLLAMTAAVIQKNGWTSASEAYDRPWLNLIPTKEIVSTQIFDRRNIEAYRPDELIPWPTAAEVEATQVYVDHLLGLEEPEGGFNDYLYNIRVIAEDGWVRPRHLGLACSIIPTVNRMRRRELEAQLTAESKFQGEKGFKWGQRKKKKFVTPLLNLKVFSTTPVEGRYGLNMKIWAADQQGNLFFIFGSSSDLFDLHPGDNYLFEGQVKDYFVDRQNREVTKLTRVRVWGDQDLAEEEYETV